MSYSLFDHTADIGVEIRGQDLPELFGEAARALRAVALPEGEVRSILSREVELEAEGLADLLVAWLSELVYLLDAEHLVFDDFQFRVLEPTRLCALLRGEEVDLHRHRPGLEVKAVTYHELEVELTEQGWRARVVFDI